MTKISDRIKRALTGSRVAGALGVERDIEDDVTKPDYEGDHEGWLRRAITTSSIYGALRAEPTIETVKTDVSEALIVGPIFLVLARAGNAVALCWRGSILRKGINRMIGRLERVGPEWTRRIIRALFVPSDCHQETEE